MGSIGNITISLGKLITAPVLIPVTHKSTPKCINEAFMVNGKSYKVTCASLGTPHGVVFVDDLDVTDVAYWGNSLENHILFPKGANIVFVQVLDKRNIKSRLWQRGKGELEFTPEAACVAMSVAKMLQKVNSDVEVTMGGNTFNVKWDCEDDDVYLTGSSELIQKSLVQRI